MLVKRRKRSVKEFTNQEVAEWMYEELMRDGYLSQAHARSIILERFGYRFVNPGRIATIVLVRWRALTLDDVTWDASNNMWHRK